MVERLDNLMNAPFWTRLPARRLQFTLDMLVLSGSFLFAYLLRFELHIPASEWNDFLVQLPLVVLLQYAALSWCGVYSFIWRYIGLTEVPAFFWAALLSAIPMILARYGLPSSLSEWRIPISVTVMDAVFVFVGTLGIRVVRRTLFERYEKMLTGARAETNKPTLLIGAGRAGVIAAKEILGRNDTGMDVRGFVDDDPQKKNAVIHGLRVLGSTDDLPRLVAHHNVEQVVITIAKTSRASLDRIIQICESIPVKARIIPGIDQILNGRVEINQIRDVQIEDLLARDQVELDVDLLRKFITGKVVMVTGAGGSIGSELCRQICRFNPTKLLLVERSEPALYAIDIELSSGQIETVPLLGDVCDEARMRGIFEQHQPQLVLHAAAHKHVPLMEDNPLEAIKNNVLGTKTLAELAGKSGTGAFVFISTDKAVRPTSIMGASKRMAELVVQSLGRRYPTRYVAVRFGNVLGSNGSVIPRFREQIKGGGPVTVTHPEMVRYFMTIPEAAQLVLEAGAMGEGGEIFVLDMGEPVKIYDLAKRMITLSGLRVGDDIPIVFSGMRKGEKLYEELMADEESTAKTCHPKIFIGRIAPAAPDEIQSGLDELERRISWNDPDGMRVFLSEFIPESKLTLPERHRPAKDQSGQAQLPLGKAVAQH